MELILLHHATRHFRVSCPDVLPVVLGTESLALVRRRHLDEVTVDPDRSFFQCLVKFPANDCSRNIDVCSKISR